ncbi:MAG: DNA primase [Rhizobacter sp.]|nr:DNA primase [Chlorobiales bacterium]
MPESLIEDIRQQADIVDVIGDYVRLKPSGRNFKGLSPFTNEKTASFIVSPEKQIYKCFSSGKGGNVFTFVAEIEKLGFIDAVKFVAKRFGIDLSAYEQPQQQLRPEEQTAYDALTFAAKFFHSALNSDEGKTALKYFLNRGLTTETISKFGLGYAYDDWDKLSQAAVDAGIPEALLLELGLVAYSERAKKNYDTFRARAMFPIFSTAGKVLGFGGRILTSEKETAKYINSPESRLYEKSKILYAMHAAKDAVRRKDEAILVEGYMDAISLHQAGVDNAVASSGTALTPQQVALIGRYTKNVLFIYDGDKAGVKAMMRGIDVILEGGLTAAIVSLPGEDDPDSFVRRVGGEEFRKFIDAHRVSFLDFKIGVMKAGGLFETPASSSDAAKELLGTLSKISDELEREMYVKALSEKLDVSLGTLQQELARVIIRAERRARPGALRTERNGTQGESRPGINRAGNRFAEGRAMPTQKTEQPQTQAESGETDATVDEPLAAEIEAAELATLKVPVAERAFLKALLESTYHGTTVIEFVIANFDILNMRHRWTSRLVNFITGRYKHNVEADPPYDFDVSNELNYLDDEALRDFVSGLLVELPISKRWPTETASGYARRCLEAILDAMSRMIAESYDEVIADVMSRIESHPDYDDLGREYAMEKSNLEKKKQRAKAEFDGAIKRLFH